MEHRSGFINVIGNPNAGKSTLVNTLSGQKLSIVTSKAQTTRHRILSIVNSEDYQLVFSDTPGILKPHYKLQEAMMGVVHEAMEDADVFLLVIDPSDREMPDPNVIEKLKRSGKPVVIALNKIDVVKGEMLGGLVEHWSKTLPDAEIIPVSAMKHTNTDKLLELILKNTPVHPPYYDKEEITDRNERFFVAEIIREKILKNYQKEIPYASEVAVEGFKEDERIIRINATVFVERESQKAIVIGHRGAALKKLGTEARLSIEHFLGKKVFLELFIKVDKDWRNSEGKLKKFGY